MDEYHSRKEWDRRTLEMIEAKLAKYSQEVQQKILERIEKELRDYYAPFSQSKELAIDPVLLSEILYKNAKDTARLVAKIIEDGIRAKDTVREIAMKLYEGYGYNDKEVLNATKTLPNYLKQALKKREFKKALRQIEKLRTKPLRIAYKKILQTAEELTDKAIQKAIYTAVQEKMRYYANRIAETEAHRALMSKRAYEYLHDKRLKLVRYRMSVSHPKMDICDFYANLDIGYGRGVVPKEMMRTLPLHPHCRCVYEPYHKKVEAKPKPWERAVKETMAKFSKKEQREILGSYKNLEKFLNGEDIEKIFNDLRPKYPIRRYAEVFRKIEYNKLMRDATKEELKKFKEIDRKIL